MDVALFSSKKYDKFYFDQANAQQDFKLIYFEEPLNESTAETASRFEAVCVFVNDRLDRKVLETLKRGKTKFIAFRCAGYNNIDLDVAKKLGFQCVRVPAYSPHAVAEHVLALVLTLYRSTHKAYNRVREGNFSLQGLCGEEIFGKTVGIVGTGNIGSVCAAIFNGFGCSVLAYDPSPVRELSAKHNVEYIALDELFERSDIITLHCPLTKHNRHMVDASAIAKMKKGVTIINTSRGALIDTQAVYQALKSRHIGFLAIDVYEEEASLFFEDLSTDIIMDDLFMRLTTFPNVLVTGHQGFFTVPALSAIAAITLNNLTSLSQNGCCENLIVPA